MSLTFHSLLGLDGLYDPPRLMTSEATLDVPSPSSTRSAEPQQSVVAAHNPASPTAHPSSDSSQSQDPSTRSMNNPTAAMESQTPQLTTPVGGPTTKGSDASSPVDNGHLSETPPSGVSAKTSLASNHVLLADLYSLVCSCILLVSLVW